MPTSGRDSRSPHGPGAWALPSVRCTQDSVLQALPAQEGLQLPPSAEKRKFKESWFPCYFVTFIDFCLPLLTSYFCKEHFHKNKDYPWWVHQALQLKVLLRSQIPTSDFITPATAPWGVSTRNADVQGLGSCFWARAATSSKARGRDAQKEQAVYAELFTTQTSFSWHGASSTVILVVQVSGNKTNIYN